MVSETPDRRAALREAYGDLFASVSKALRTSDPMGLIALGAPPDEYEPEVSTILPRLRAAASIADVQAIVHEEFTKWFAPDDAGPEDRYLVAASEIWSAYQHHKERVG